MQFIFELFHKQYLLLLFRFLRFRVHEKFGLPYYAPALLMGLLLLVAVFLMEWFIPWKEDLDPLVSNGKTRPNFPNPDVKLQYIVIITMPDKFENTHLTLFTCLILLSSCQNMISLKHV